MHKTFSFRKLLAAPAMLFLCGIFFQSCTEEMPILTPTSITGSYVSLNIDNKTYTIVNRSPGYIYFSNVTVGSGNVLSSQYSISASNSSQTNPLGYILNFSNDTTSTNGYAFASSQLYFNNKTYITANPYNKAQLTIDQLNDANKTASGSFAYYLYNSVSAPTDSIYVSGTFNIKN